MRLGVEAANTDTPIPEKWFDGIAALEVEAGPMASKENSKRGERHMMGKLLARMRGVFGG